MTKRKLVDYKVLRAPDLNRLENMVKLYCVEGDFELVGGVSESQPGGNYYPMFSQAVAKYQNFEVTQS